MDLKTVINSTLTDLRLTPLDTGGVWDELNNKPYTDKFGLPYLLPWAKDSMDILYASPNDVTGKLWKMHSIYNPYWERTGKGLTVPQQDTLSRINRLVTLDVVNTISALSDIVSNQSDYPTLDPVFTKLFRQLGKYFKITNSNIKLTTVARKLNKLMQTGAADKLIGYDIQHGGKLYGRQVERIATIVLPLVNDIDKLLEKERAKKYTLHNVTFAHKELVFIKLAMEYIFTDRKYHKPISEGVEYDTLPKLGSVLKLYTKACSNISAINSKIRVLTKANGSKPFEQGLQMQMINLEEINKVDLSKLADIERDIIKYKPNLGLDAKYEGYLMNGEYYPKTREEVENMVQPTQEEKKEVLVNNVQQPVQQQEQTVQQPIRQQAQQQTMQQPVQQQVQQQAQQQPVQQSVNNLVSNDGFGDEFGGNIAVGTPMAQQPVQQQLVQQQTYQQQVLQQPVQQQTYQQQPVQQQVPQQNLTFEQKVLLKKYGTLDQNIIAQMKQQKQQQQAYQQNMINTGMPNQGMIQQPMVQQGMVQQPVQQGYVMQQPMQQPMMQPVQQQGYAMQGQPMQPMVVPQQQQVMIPNQQQQQAMMPNQPQQQMMIQQPVQQAMQPVQQMRYQQPMQQQMVQPMQQYQQPVQQQGFVKPYGVPQV